MNAAYIVDAIRTPIGKYGGTLATVRPDDLAALVIKEILKRNASIPSSVFEEVIFGAANQAGEDNRNVARMALLLAGMPVTVAGVTVNRLCASGLQAIVDAARGVMTGDGDLYIAGGVESMSRAPFVMPKSESAFSRQAEVFDTTIGWRFINSKLSALYHPYAMGETAENVASKWNISRHDQDAFAFQSQQKYQHAMDTGIFGAEILPVSVKAEKGITTLFEKDEHPRLTSLDKLASLKPAFKEGGSVTAGNSSGINDGAAACIVAGDQALKSHNLKPLVRIVSIGIAGVDPAYMGVGPVPATQKALKRAGIKIQDIGLVELNEAFAAQSLACIRDLEIDPSIVNVNGGAIALGHPLGCSGVRISTTLIHEMKRRRTKYGLATMCIGVGQGMAVILENV